MPAVSSPNLDASPSSPTSQPPPHVGLIGATACLPSFGRSSNSRAHAPEFERWLETERAALQEAASDAARTLVDRCEAGGDLTAAAQWARRATRLAPFDEGVLRRLVVLLDRLGDRAGAVATYEAFAKRLAADLEVEPAAETKALLTAVQARQTVAPVDPSSATLDRARRTAV